MTTARDIITLALKDSGVIGVGQTPSAEDINDNLLRLNMMLAEWNRKRWIVWNLVATGITSTGAQSYTVGPGGDFNIPRPSGIEDAYMRLLNPPGNNQVDYDLDVIEAREDYDEITLKSLVSWPSYCFYDSGYPIGSVYFWPIPQPNQFELFIVTKTNFPAITNLSAPLVFPPEYMPAILYNLAARMRPAYQLPPDPTVIALAGDTLNTIRNSNAQVSRLDMPQGLGRGMRYNIYSDRGSR